MNLYFLNMLIVKYLKLHLYHFWTFHLLWLTNKYKEMNILHLH